MQFHLPPQRVDSQLTALDDALKALSVLCAPVPERIACVDDCMGLFVARDVHAPFASPPCDVAARDGYAVSSVDLIGASSFSPAYLMARPKVVCVGEALPDNCDCVVDFDCVAMDGPPFAINVSACPGQGVRRVGADAIAGSLLMPAGSRVQPYGAQLLRLAGLTHVHVRQPRVRLVDAPASGGSHTFAMVSALASTRGALVEHCICASRNADAIAQGSMQSAAQAPDLLIIVGGTGSGADDHVIEALRHMGAQIAHGVALLPGSTIAVGGVNDVPFIALPGRFDGALAGYLSLVSPALRMLCAAPPPAPLEGAPLLRKLSSAPGVSDVVLLERASGGWAPSPAGDMSVAQALRADGYLIVDAGGEGLGGGAIVRPLPFPGCLGD